MKLDPTAAVCLGEISMDCQEDNRRMYSLARTLQLAIKKQLQDFLKRTSSQKKKLK